MAQKVSGVPGLSWTCIIVDERSQRGYSHAFSISSANNRLYVGLFFLSFLMFLLGFSYKRKFKATEFGVGDYEDVELMVRMQKVFAASPPSCQ